MKNTNNPKKIVYYVISVILMGTALLMSFFYPKDDGGYDLLVGTMRAIIIAYGLIASLIASYLLTRTKLHGANSRLIIYFLVFILILILASMAV